MKPDRSNYEIWFIDWLDGNLNKQQIEDLKLFLAENPDLQEEYNDISLISLEPADSVFTGKSGLKKSPGSYSGSQFEHLCIACLENDLTPSQKAELDEITDQDKDRRNQFELIQKLKLKPAPGSFGRKSAVKKITADQMILRWSVIALSSAAAIAFLVIAYIFTSAKPGKEILISDLNRRDTLFIRHHTPIIISEITSPGQTDPEPGIGNKSTEILNADQNTLIADNIIIEIPDSIPGMKRSEALSDVKVKIDENLIKAYRPSANSLVAIDTGNMSIIQDDRRNMERFLAKFFHEKVMRDTTAGSRPVESFEIAEAGITGLNKLLGWEMALQKNTDENGNVRSYYFSSRLLKFNAPVKKSATSM